MQADSHHRFVNTTPKPRATKKSKGELVGPDLPSSVFDGAGADEVEVGSAMVGDVYGRWSQASQDAQ